MRCSDGPNVTGENRNSTAGYSPNGRISTSSRRAFIAGGTAVTLASVGGCLSLGNTSGSDDGGPEPPWTTEELADHVDDEATVTIYAGTGSDQQWYDLIDVINDEFGTSIEGNVVASDSSTISQRFLSERQAGNDKADVVSTASNLLDKIKNLGKNEGLDRAEKWFESGIDENFWFKDVLPSDRLMSFQVAGFNGGASLCMPVSTDIFEEKGLDYPTTYNDLLDDQYEGLSVAFSNYVAPFQIGWITRYHAKKTDMSNMEWIKSLMSRFEVVGVKSHSAGTREVGKDNVAMMLYNWPESAAPFVKNPDLNVKGVFTDPVKADAIDGPTSINKEAPNPWVARYFVSALLEKPVQRRMFNDVTDMVPVRSDLDLSGMDLHPFTKERLSTNLEKVGFWEGGQYAEIGQKAVDTGIFKP